jgi:hypothetical protein
MSQTNLITLIVGGGAVFVALLGYLLAQVSARRDGKAKTYAIALESVKQFEELPYRISRRPTSDATVRSEFGNSMSDAYVKLELYRAWTLIDSPVAGRAYDLLLRQTHQCVRDHIDYAWRTSPVSEDGNAQLKSKFDCDNKREWDLCIHVMRNELSLWSMLLRPATKRLLRRYQVDRPVVHNSRPMDSAS